MLTLEINNKEIEKSLLEKFKTVDEIKDYFYELIIEDLEDKRFGDILSKNDKSNFVKKEDVFKVLDNI